METWNYQFSLPVNDGKWHALNVGNPWVNLDGKKSLNANERGRLPQSEFIMKNTLRPKGEMAPFFWEINEVVSKFDVT